MQWGSRLALRFIFSTFLITWLLWIGLALLARNGLVSYGEPLFMVLFILGGLAPTITALITLRQSPGDLSIFKTELIRYKVNGLWYIGLLALPAVLSGLGWLANLLVTNEVSPFFEQPFYIFFLLIPVMVIGGGLEELGWRGLLLPQLLKETSPFRATLLVAVIWGVWHLPLWFIPGTNQEGTSYFLFLLMAISLSFVLSTLYIMTRSILICILFHAVENAYLGIGLNNWAQGFEQGLLNAVLALLVR